MSNKTETIADITAEMHELVGIINNKNTDIPIRQKILFVAFIDAFANRIEAAEAKLKKRIAGLRRCLEDAVWAFCLECPACDKNGNCTNRGTICISRIWRIILEKMEEEEKEEKEVTE